MRANMDETDLEKFDQFVERHWKNKTRQTVSVSSSVTEEKPKRRGRRPKTEV